ncbi:MAG: tRNA adenosine(34) deaminase TadA [Andreesenia angusta]|nr:tRNA adenosine(34) deaminase TadA [Andreesenia angusta]
MDNFFMKKAYLEAVKAKDIGEVPVGAVVVKDGKIIGSGFNTKEETFDTTNHAEIIAIRAASKYLKSWRLTGCTLYTTLEPCPMCAGAIMNSRLTRIVIGTRDKRMGACGSALNILQNDKLNHKTEIKWNIMQRECSNILKMFFKELREGKLLKELND